MWKKITNYYSKYHQIQQPICQICLQQLNRKNALQLCNCQHVYCGQCVAQYINTKIKSFEIIKCLDQTCTSQINQKSQFYSSFTKQRKYKYEKIKRFYFVSKNPDFKLCPKESCKGLVNIKKKPCKCNACSQKYCPKCLLKEHWGRCQKQSIVYLENNLNYIQCSYCNFVIQKNEGCDHITCKCGYQLCYKCGGVWNGPKHMCVRSKGFQRVRSWLVSLMQRLNIFTQNTFLRRTINAFGTMLLNILYANLVLAVILTVVETIYDIFSLISPLGYIYGLLSGEQEVISVEEVKIQEEGGFPYVWVYMGLVFVSWCILAKLRPDYKMKYFLMVVGVVTGILYFLLNIFLVFYYEYVLICYIIENIMLIGGFVIFLLGIVYSANRIFSEKRIKRMVQNFNVRNTRRVHKKD